MKKLFDYVRDNVLHGMPSGCLVTKDAITFDIGMWQHKTYDALTGIYQILRGKWTPHTINLIIMDKQVTVDEIKAFVTVNGYEVSQRAVYNVNCIAIPDELVTNELADWLKTRKYPFNNYRNKVHCEGHTIFVSDFIKNLLLY